MIFYSINEVLEMAIQIEKNGYQFYSQSKEKTKDEKLQNLFDFLATEELKHMETFNGIKDRLKTTPYKLPYDWEEAKLYLKAITDSYFFTGKDKVISLMEKVQNAEELINLALAFEKETLLFYYEILNLVAEEEKPEVVRLINEEKSHIKKLEKIKGEIK
ncbi:MAG: ferritin family protein [candidate division WOR-3 bacterium]|nr:ferritin family protein [candidate division WOR-3 bacterium]MDW8113508.1 ferritin family protein [candidate division WOR-3 bacterium]